MNKYSKDPDVKKLEKAAEQGDYDMVKKLIAEGIKDKHNRAMLLAQQNNNQDIKCFLMTNYFC